jgi:hypothetical protein
MGSWVLLLGWLAVLFDRNAPKTGDAFAVVPGQTALPEIQKEESEKPPSPQSN